MTSEKFIRVLILYILSCASLAFSESDLYINKVSIDLWSDNKNEYRKSQGIRH